MIKVTVLGSGNVGFHLINLFHSSTKIHLNEWYSRSLNFDDRVKVINQIDKLIEEHEKLNQQSSRRFFK